MATIRSDATAAARSERVFPALLRYWRSHRGMSQLDLALTAEVSSRHISFLETGRSKPSREMVLLLAEALDVPLRDRNEVLRAAGYGPQYPEPTVDAALQGPLGEAVDMMLDHHEPYPMVVVDRLYELVRMNRSAAGLLALVGVETTSGRGGTTSETNLLRMLFDPEMKAMVANWEETAGTVLRRLQREALHRPQDEAMADLLADLLGRDGVPKGWRRAEFTEPSDPLVPLRFRVDDVELAFLTTITSFNAPQNLTLDELRVESWFPLDPTTETTCRNLLT